MISCDECNTITDDKAILCPWMDRVRCGMRDAGAVLRERGAGGEGGGGGCTGRCEMIHAIYGLQPIGKDDALEADGEIHWYCSKDHAKQDLKALRQEMGTEATAYSEPSENHDALDGTLCEWCGKKVQP